MNLQMNYERDEKTREARTHFTDRDICGAVACVITMMAPGRRVRKIETIVDKFTTELHNHMLTKDEGNRWERAFTTKELSDMLHEILFNIPEFMELNLSQNEYEAGVVVDDESRPSFAFTSMYDKEDANTLRRDFIDLDACHRNIVNMIYYLDSMDDDCFLCDWGIDKPGESEYCQTCIRNPKFSDQWHHMQLPRGKHNSVCEHTCDLGYYFCCKECDRDECRVRCQKAMSDSYKDCPNLYDFTKPEDQKNDQ